MTPSIRNALDDLGLRHVIVIYPGAMRFPIAERIEAVPPRQVFAVGEPLFEISATAENRETVYD